MHNDQLTKTIIDVFESRTQLHIRLVSDNLLKMENYWGLTRAELSARALMHDASKFHPPERDAYAWMTWVYYCKKQRKAFTCSQTIEDIILHGWQHHIHHNRHHPEAHTDLNTMTELDIVEMVCDWTAISQENDIDNGCCLNWAYNHVDKKWNFSAKKKAMIFSAIKELNERNKQRIDCPHVAKGLT